MKKKKAIVIKNPLLRNLRNNLRTVILYAVYEELKKLGNEERHLMFENNQLRDQTPKEKERENYLFDKQAELRRAKNHSICKCPVCSKTDNDMTYNTYTQYWYCLDCYNELPKSLMPDWRPEYPLRSDQVAAFFYHLERLAHRCRTNYGISRRIMKLMGIDEKDQDKFLDICKEYGGHCDCEIIMNAQQYIKPYYINWTTFKHIS